MAEAAVRDCDVAILGGGVAGAATALSLLRHAPELSVAIVERGAYSRPRIGETLPPQVLALLQQLGVWESFRRRGDLPAHGTCAAWGQAELHYHEFLSSPYGHGWHLDRRAFDAWLAGEAVARGAALSTGARVAGHERRQDGWALDVERAGGGRLRLRARFAVDATGRLAAFARRQGARKRRIDRLVGLYCFFSFDQPLADTYTLVEAVAGGWWYSALLPDGRLVAALMTDADLARRERWRDAGRWHREVEGARHTRERLAGASAEGPPAVAAAQSQRLDRVTGPGWLAAGDAASTYDPLSSLGILKALRAGLCASYAVLDELRGVAGALVKYERLVADEWAAYLEKRAETYGRERRFSDSPFWRRRQAG